jgi:hypothetical protein
MALINHLTDSPPSSEPQVELLGLEHFPFVEIRTQERLLEPA